MNRKLRILVIIGTRPEAVKLAPLVLAFRASPGDFEVRVCTTGQHRELTDQVLDFFGITPDVRLEVMREGQHLTDLAGRLLLALRPVIEERHPDWVVVQGDTTSALAGGLAGFYGGVRVAHLEAGLRTYRRREPFPEELHRRLLTNMADLHLAPTAAAVRHLREEGIAESEVLLCGNTVVDALHRACAQLAACSYPAVAAVQERLARQWSGDQKLILVTVHRRENQGTPLQRLIEALRQIAGRGDVHLVLPVHPSPEVGPVLTEALSGVPRITLFPALRYEAFLWLMIQSDLILTDSGGVQEEAAVLGKPMVVLRRVSERPEVLTAGLAVLAAPGAIALPELVARWLDDPSLQRPSTGHQQLFGDGKAGERIVSFILDREKRK